MYLFLPAINKGIGFLSEIEFRTVVINTIALFIFWKDIKSPIKEVFCINGVSSMIWVLTNYLTGAYIGKYIKIKFGYKKFIFCSINSSVFIISTIIYCILYINKLYKKNIFIQKNYIYIKIYIYR